MTPSDAGARSQKPRKIIRFGERDEIADDAEMSVVIRFKKQKNVHAIKLEEKDSSVPRPITSELKRENVIGHVRRQVVWEMIMQGASFPRADNNAAETRGGCPREIYGIFARVSLQ